MQNSNDIRWRTLLGCGAVAVTAAVVAACGTGGAATETGADAGSPMACADLAALRAA